jgi:TMEM175 potassium channel family protein
MSVQKEFSVSRVEAFSDGVLAIIITLLVLEMRPPELHAPESVSDTLVALAAMKAKFASFFLSFFFIAVFWVNHHRFFVHIRDVNGGLLWLNNLLLLMLSFIPFPTAFIGDHPRNTVALALFALVLMLAGIVFNSMWRFARARRLAHDSIPESIIASAARKGLFGPLAYGIAAMAAPFSCTIPWAIFFIVPAVYALPSDLMFKRRK